MTGRKKTRASTPQPSSNKSKSSSPSSMSKKMLFSIVAAAFIAVFTALDYARANFYVFDPQSLHQVALSALSENHNSTHFLMQDIVQRLQSNPKWSPYLNTHSIEQESEWMFNNAGGAMGSMFILHASITEYLIFFGTPIGTEGHTGRHTADDFFHILTGEQFAFKAGALEAERYPPGSQHYLPRGTVKQYMMPEGGCWALEYAQGWIPPMMPFGLADVISSTLDFPTFGVTCWITAREMGKNLFKGKF